MDTFAFTIPPKLDTERDVASFIAELNENFRRIGSKLAQLEGQDGIQTKLLNGLDLDGKRICNVGRSENAQDVAPIDELRERALYRTEKIHTTNFLIEARAGIRVPATHSDDQAVPLSQVEDVINDASDELFVNGTEVEDADFDDALPLAPTGAQNVEWQLDDTVDPNSISAHLNLAALVDDLLPATHNAFDLGTDTGPFRWRNLLLEGNADIDGTLNVEGAVTFQDGFTLGSFTEGIIKSSGAGVLSSSTVDLADDTFEVSGILAVDHGGTNVASYTAGSVIFAGAGGTSLTEDNSNFFWNDSTNILGVGTPTPGASFIDGGFEVRDGQALFDWDNPSTASGIQSALDVVHNISAPANALLADRYGMRVSFTKPTTLDMGRLFALEFICNSSGAGALTPLVVGASGIAKLGGSSTASLFGFGGVLGINCATSTASTAAGQIADTVSGGLFACAGGGVGSTGSLPALQGGVFVSTFTSGAIDITNLRAGSFGTTCSPNEVGSVVTNMSGFDVTLRASPTVASSITSAFGAFIDLSNFTGALTTVTGDAIGFRIGAWVVGPTYTGDVIGLQLNDCTIAGNIGIRQLGTTPVNRLQGNTTIGTDANPVASALLDLSSTTGALMVPRMTTAQRVALAGANGMIVYDTTLALFAFFEAGFWTSGNGTLGAGLA